MKTFIVDFIDTATRHEIDQLCADRGWSILSTYSNFVNTFLISSPDDLEFIKTLSSVERATENDPMGVELVDYQQSFPQDLSDVREINSNDGLEWWKLVSIKNPSTDSLDNEQHIVRGQNVRCYIVDSGIASSHPEFATSDIELLYSFTGDFTDNKGHGTAIASIIGGGSCGLSKAKLSIVKIFEPNTPILQSQILDALDSILTDYNTKGKQASVVNMSWNIAHNDFIDSKISHLVDSGILVVAASGNDGATIADRTPASNPRVITIGAYDVTLYPCNFSNYTSPLPTTPGATNGGELDGWAPGANIRVANHLGGYYVVAGTSIAAAIHSSAVAYNLSFYLVNNNQVGRNVTGNVQAMNGALSLSKAGLLYLEGVYAASVNKVTTFCTKQNDYKDYGGGVGTFVVGDSVKLELFNTLNVASISYNAPLPNGMYIENGFLCGVAGSIDVPAVYTEMQITLRMRDDTTKNIIMMIGVTQQPIPDNYVPNSDPVIDVILALPVCCAWYTPYLEGNCLFGTNCEGVCNNFVDTGNPKDEGECTCGPADEDCNLGGGGP